MVSVRRMDNKGCAHMGPIKKPRAGLEPSVMAMEIASVLIASAIDRCTDRSLNQLFVVFRMSF